MNKEPAFPCESGPYLLPGMTLRDYFASKVLQGDSTPGDCDGSWSTSVTDEQIAKRCALYFRIADAMLEARETKVSGETPAITKTMTQSVAKGESKNGEV